MPVVGNADQDGVDILAVENFAVVIGRGDVVSEDFLDVRPPAFVKVDGGHEFDAGHFQGRFGVDEPDDAHADRGDPDAVVGTSAGGGRLGKHFRRFGASGQRGGRRTRRDGLQEGTAAGGLSRRGHEWLALARVTPSFWITLTILIVFRVSTRTFSSRPRGDACSERDARLFARAEPGLIPVEFPVP